MVGRKLAPPRLNGFAAGVLPCLMFIPAGTAGATREEAVAQALERPCNDQPERFIDEPGTAEVCIHDTAEEAATALILWRFFSSTKR